MQSDALDFIQDSSENTGIWKNEKENARGLEDVQFELVGWPAFEIAEKMAKAMEAEDEAVMMSEAMKRMNYERKIPASLYAFTGFAEYLNLKLNISNQEKMVSSKEKDKDYSFLFRQLIEDHLAA